MTNKEKLKELADHVLQIYKELLYAEINCLVDCENEHAAKSLKTCHRVFACVSREFSSLREKIETKHNIDSPFEDNNGYIN